jgi:hypothetical protein
MASIWNSTEDCPGRVRIVAGSCREGLELDSRTSAAVLLWTSRKVMRHLAEVWALNALGEQERLPVEVPSMLKVAAELVPLKLAVMITLPDAEATDVARKLALSRPGRTVTVAGTAIAAELELSVTVVAVGAVCESVTVQEVVSPDITPVEPQVIPPRVVATPSEMAVDWLAPL